MNVQTNDRPLHVEVELEVPLPRGEKMIGKLRLRRPKSGELRGLSLGQLCQMNVDEIRKLLPRISTALTAEGEELGQLTLNDVDQVDSADIVEISDKVTDFLLSTRRRAELPTT